MKRVLLSRRWSRLSLSAIVLAATFFTYHIPVRATGLTTMAQYWRYEFDGDSSWPHRVYVAGEIRNDSGQYVKNVAVRVILRSIAGSELARETGVPRQETLAPGESTFFSDRIYDDSSWLTDSIELTPFGDPATPGEYPFLGDPEPVYLEQSVDGGRVTYYGEFLNGGPHTWMAGCEYCAAVGLVGVYYADGQIVDWDSVARPHGHLPPGSKVAFRFSFEREPGGTFKLFSHVGALPQGQYPTSWSVENLSWRLDTDYIYPRLLITARIRNTSNVAAEPDVWFVGRNASGQWVGWTYASIWDPIPPGGHMDVEDDISSASMHAGALEGIQSVEALVASSDVSDQPPPTPAPTSTRTPVPTHTPTRTVTPSVTPSPRPTNTPFPTPEGGWPYEGHLPLMVN